MSIDTKSRHITPVGGNVFADLGFEQEEATLLKAERNASSLKRLPSRIP